MMVKERRVLLFFVLGIFLILGFSKTAFAAEYPAEIRTEAEEKDYSGKLVVLHSNDVHGAFEGYSQMTALAETYRAMGAEVVIVDAGDLAQGNIYTNLSKGHDAIKLMNAAGYTFSTIGNHDFDYGTEVTAELIKEADFTFLCADIYNDGKLLCKTDDIYTAKNGVRIGFFGLGTPETKSKTDPVLVTGLTIPDGDALAACAKEQVKDLKDKGAGLVIALTHLGVDAVSADKKNRSIDIYKAVPEIDFIIDGHSHTVMTEGSDHEPIQSTGDRFKNIGVVVISADAKIEEHFLISTEKLPMDTEVKAMVDKIKASVDAKYADVIGQSELVLNGVREDVRTKETNCADFITDAIYWYTEQHKELYSGFEGDKFVLINGGAIRASVPQGDVTKNNIYDLCPYGNMINVVNITGKELLELLEASTCATPEKLGGFPQTKGITYTIDTTKAFDKGETYPDSEYFRPASIQRVSIDKIDGKPFDPEKTYAMYTLDFLTNGGDQAYVLKGKETRSGVIPIDQILESYLDEVLGGKITEEKYGKVRGELTIIYAKNGWVKDQGKWYYFKDQLACRGWEKISGKWYYFKDDGSMAENEICGGYRLRYGGSWDGKGKGSWHKNSKGWWYTFADGTYAKNEWLKINDKWYYFRADGYMLTGWLKYKDTWYYLNGSGAMVTGWCRIREAWYYFDTAGRMYADTTIANKYYVDKNGRWDGRG